MDRLKTFLKYALWLIGFFILSNFLIYVGLNSSYRDIERRDNVEEVQVYQAEATKVNGRIRGVIQNIDEKNLAGKYVEIDMYSKRDVFLGREYIQIEAKGQGEPQAFEMLFKLQDVASYEIKIVDEKQEGGELELLDTDLTTQEIIVLTAFTFLILW